ncbi:MAG TPA: ABC transporter permease [Limnochordales bacterium]
MARHIILRLLRALIVAFIVVTAVFFAFRLTPGDPARQIAGLGASEEAVRRVRVELGLDRPVWEQYVDYLAGVARLDLGRSHIYARPVLDIILEHLPPTLALAGAAMGLAVVLGVPIGIISALKPYSWFDAVVTFLSVSLLSIPNFWLGLILINYFAVRLNWLPAGGYGGLSFLILPAVAVAARILALVSRTVRSSVLETVQQDYVRTARAKGLPEAVVVGKHILRNALIPVITLVGMQTGYLLGGSIVIETLFSYQGTGWLFISGIGMRDYALVQGLTIFYTLGFLLLTLVVDLVYTWVDPRIRYR